MAISSCHPRRSQLTFIHSLAPEILASVFKHVLDHQNLRDIIAVRMVCRHFDEIATPIQYQTLILTKRLLYHPNPSRLSTAFANIRQHTNHVVGSIGEDESCVENHGAVARITEIIIKLSSFTWRYSPSSSAPACTCPLGSMFLRTPGGQTLRKETKVYVECLAPRYMENFHDLYLSGLPTELLVSLKMAYPNPPFRTDTDGLKQVLLRSRNMRTLQYRDRGQGTSLRLTGTERLPAFEELHMECYDWTHSQAEVARHWDFSRIRSLELIDMPVLRALRSLDPWDLWGLHTLATRDSGISDGREELSRELDAIVRSRVAALERLELTVDTRFFGTDALLRHAATLRHLSFRDFVGFSDDSRRCPTMWVGDLERLASELVELRTLELDMDTARTDPPLFLRALCMFPKLHTLTLHVHTVVHPYEELPHGIDKDRDVSMQLFSFLTSERAKAMAAANGSGEPPRWRRVTLNVGGWKPVMVRRLSPSWKAQNRRGVFAERCFVMQQPVGSLMTSEPYETREVACDELGRDQREPLHHVFRESIDDDTENELERVVRRMGRHNGSDSPQEFSYRDFTEAVLEYIHRGTLPPGPIFAHQT